MEKGVVCWIVSGAFLAIFLGAVVVEQWMIARKCRNTQEKAGNSVARPPQAETTD
jgi:hypothetical protein